MNLRSVILFFFLSTNILFILSASADPLPDYYSEPGVNAFRKYENQAPAEYIDPMSGGLTRRYTDLVVPGNAGLDIVVQRFYRAPSGDPGVLGSDYLTENTVLGEGWDMHFGRIWYGSSFAAPGTTCGSNNVRTGGNPILELPDGTRQELVNSKAGESYGYISNELWIGICNSSTELEVVSPAGMRYLFNLYRPYAGDNAWHVTQITDSFGNFLTIDYYPYTQQALIEKISSSDGREVTFHYDNVSVKHALLQEIRLNGTWKAKYRYDDLTSRLTFDYPFRYYLDEVERRDEKGIWDYNYYDNVPSSSNHYGLYAMKSVEAPTGLLTTYTYKKVNFHPLRNTTALATKSVSGADVTPAIWTYNYTPSSGSVDHDTTTISSPNACSVYEHTGSAVADNGEVWRIGTLQEKRIYNNSNCSSSLLRTEIYNWVSLELSSQDLAHRRSPAYDANYSKPILQNLTIEQDNATFSTTYSDFDKYGFPQTTTESGPNSSSRVTTISYSHFDDTATWIIGQEDEATISGLGTIDNNYYTSGVRRGSLRSVSEYGRTAKQYDYYTSGSNKGAIRTITDELGNTVTYSNYYRGTPEKEDHPESLVVLRNVNSTGTVQWEENGSYAGRATYGYDHFNRVISITTPKSSDNNVVISWANGGRIKNVSRGTFNATYVKDGYFNDINSNVEGVRKQYSYTEEGFLESESYLSTSASSAGLTYIRDALGRPTRQTHQNGDYRTWDYTYTVRNSVRVRDELAHYTTYRYRSYGDPSEKFLIQVDSPESITTVMGRNAIGMLTSVSQGGQSRSFVLDNKLLLDYETHPETGTTQITSDDMGNITNKSVGGSSSTIFTYDDLNRLDYINYPSGTPDVDFVFDTHGRLEYVLNATADWQYGYDDNDNLESESATVLGVTYEVGYHYDDLDNLDTITYPNDLVVTYTPDDLGRTTSISGVLSSITYHPNGQPHVLTYTNGVTTTITQDARKRTDTISAPNVLDLDYDYNAANNLDNLTDGLSSSNNLDLEYDDVNRLETAQGPWGAGSFNYSTDGDFQSKRLGSTTTNTYAYSSNRLSGISGGASMNFSYDDYGNVTSNGTDTFDYNDALQLTDVPSKGISYGYDGNNRRVLKLENGTPQVIYLYGKHGKLLYEADLEAGTSTAYIYLGSMLVGKYVDGSATGGAVTLPLSEDFEGTAPLFTNTGQYNWIINSGTTPSGSTGPSGGANDSDQYAYMETSSGYAYNAGDQVIYESPTFLIESGDVAFIEFMYHMYGANIGQLQVQSYNSVKGTWNTEWTLSGQQHSSTTSKWTKENFQLIRTLAGAQNKVRFVGIAAGGYQGDMAIDEVRIYSQPAPPPPTPVPTPTPEPTPIFIPSLGSPVIEDFSGTSIDQSDSLFRNSGNYSWMIGANGTPSGYTGPSSSDGNFVFFETSGGYANTAGNEAILESKFFQIFSQNQGAVDFEYHMHGADTGTLYMDINYHDVWHLNHWNRKGQQNSSQASAWFQEEFDLGQFCDGSPLKIRFRAVAAGGYRGDIALDNIVLRGGSNSRVAFKNATWDGTWLYLAWTDAKTVSSYNLFAIGDNASTGRKFKSIVTEGALIDDGSERGTYRYQYFHKNDLCAEFGSSTEPFILSGQIWPNGLSAKASTYNNIGELTCP